MFRLVTFGFRFGAAARRPRVHAQVAFHAADVLLHELGRGTAVALLERLDDLDVLGLRVFGRMAALVHQCDQLRARQQVGDQFGQYLVAEQARQHHVEVGQQPRAAAHVAALDGIALVLQVRAQLGDLRVGDARRQVAGHAAFHQPAQLEHLARLLGRHGRHESATRGQQRDQPAAAQLVECLAHHRARDREHVGDLLLHELGARHQPLFDDGVGDRLDDLVGGARRITRRARRIHQAQGGGRFAWHDGLETIDAFYCVQKITSSQAHVMQMGSARHHLSSDSALKNSG
jgi:hypothetical protein